MHNTVITRITRPFALAALLAAPLGLGASAALASPKTSTPAAEKKESALLPKTPQENLAKADEYKKKAAAYRAEAAAHRKMFEAYKLGVPGPESGPPLDDSNFRSMRIHCEGYINKADALATEAEKFADFYQKRATDLQGK